MPSSQNDIGLFANVLTMRKQEQINVADGLIHTLSPPSGLAGVNIILVLQAQGGAFRFSAVDAYPPTTSFGLRVADGASVTWMPADLTPVKLIRDGTDATKVNVVYWTFARTDEV